MSRILSLEEDIAAVTNNPNRASSLHLAAASGDLTEVQRLLRAANSLAGLREGDDLGLTPLHYACLSGQDQVIEFILYLAPSLADQRANDGSLPLHAAAASRCKAAVQVMLRNNNHHIEARNCSGWTALHYAASKSDLDTIRVLANAGATINAIASDGSSPLHIAAASDHVEAIEYMFASSFDDEPDIDCGDFELRTPLLVATIQGSVRAVEALLKQGCQVDCVDRDGWTVLHCACYAGNLDITKRLIYGKTDINKFSTDGQTPLQVAILFQNYDVMVLLLESGADVNLLAETKDAQQAIHVAAQLGDTHAMDLLYKYGAKHDAQCISGRTPLFNCLVAGQTHTMKWLYGRGESLNIVDSTGNNLLHTAARNTNRSAESWDGLIELFQNNTTTSVKELLSCRNHLGYTPFLLAITNHDIPLAAKILQANTEVINWPSYSKLSSLHIACIQGDLEMVQFLLAAGADVNSQELDVATPLHQSAKLGYVEIIELLLDSGANIESRMKQYGLTSVHLAAQQGQVDALKLLARHGADLSVLTSEGNSCLHYAVGKPSFSSAIFLLEKGLDPTQMNNAKHDVLSMAVSGGDIHIVEVVRNAAQTHLLRSSLDTTMHGMARMTVLSTEDQACNDHTATVIQYTHGLRMQKGSFGHLPEILSSNEPFVEIPYLATHLYDGPSLEAYLTKRGWCLEPNTGVQIRFSAFGEHILEPQDTSLRPAPLRDVLSLLQGCFFFGIIIEYFKACEILVNTDEFVTDSKDGKIKIITTAPLSRYFKHLKDSEENLPIDKQREHLRDVYQSIKAAKNLFDELGLVGRMGSEQPLISDPDDGMQRMLFAIALICETLDNAVAQIWPAAMRLEFEPKDSENVIGEQRKTMLKAGGPNQELWPALSSFPGIQSRWIFDRMVSKGWCPNQISMFQNSMLGVTAMFLISMLARPKAPLHQSCSKIQCNAFNIEESTYECRHVESCTNCDNVAVNNEEVVSILKRGGVPAVIIRDEDPSGTMTLQVAETKYIAISHVWADGRGNPKENSLPRCQLKKLKHMIDQITAQEGNTAPAPAIWIDTLCVPVDTEPRRLALGLLTQTYHQADKVLVLDAELENSSCHVSLEEIFARMLCSAWLQRLWTLQESVVDCLLVQFRDGQIDVAVKKMEARKKLFLQPHCSQLGLWDLTSMFSSKIALGTVEDKFSEIGQLGEAITYRSTSKPSDQHICLASLLGLEVKKLAMIPQSDSRKRVSCFYELLSQKSWISTSILFAPGPRLDVDGFRWALTSFLTESSGAASNKLNMIPPIATGKCKLHDSGFGLNVTIGGWLINDLDVPLDHHFVFRDPRTLVNFRGSNKDRKDGLWSDERDWRQGRQGQTAILFSLWYVAAAALVAVVENEDGVITARYLWRLEIGKTSLFDDLLSISDREISRGVRVENRRRDLPQVLRSVEALPEDQKWRIL